MGLARAAALAAAPGGGCGFAKLRGPDHLPANPHPAKDLRHRLAVAGMGEAKAFDAAGLYRFAACPKKAAVNGAPHRGPKGAANRNRGQARNSPTHRSTKRSTRCRQKNGRHHITSSPTASLSASPSPRVLLHPAGACIGKAKRATIRRCQGLLSAVSTTPWPQ